MRTITMSSDDQMKILIVHFMKFPLSICPVSKLSNIHENSLDELSF